MERCADILLSIREEIHETGNYVGIELQEQITKLVEYVHRPSLQSVAHSAPNRAFARVQALLQKHTNLPFIQRYLKRDDILQAIQACDAELTSTLDVFSVGLESLARVNPNSFPLDSSPSKSVCCARSTTQANSGKRQWRPS